MMMGMMMMTPAKEVVKAVGEGEDDSSKRTGKPGC
jgi:hypothetical protein